MGPLGSSPRGQAVLQRRFLDFTQLDAHQPRVPVLLQTWG